MWSFTVCHTPYNTRTHTHIHTCRTLHYVGTCAQNSMFDPYIRIKIANNKIHQQLLTTFLQCECANLHDKQHNATKMGLSLFKMLLPAKTRKRRSRWPQNEVVYCITQRPQSMGSNCDCVTTHISPQNTLPILVLSI